MAQTIKFGADEIDTPAPPKTPVQARVDRFARIAGGDGRGFRPEGLPAAGAALGSIAGPPGAAVGGAVGSLAKQLIQPTTTDPAEAASTVVKDAALQGAIQKGGELIGAGMQKAAPWLMQKALKPAKSILDEYRTTGPRIVKTLLDEGVGVTAAGLEKLQNLLRLNNTEIRQLIQNTPGAVDKKVIAARAIPVASRVANQANPAQDLKAVAESVDEFIKHPIYTKPTMTHPELQDMKVGTYQAIGKKYGEMSNASVETQKALARGAKEEIAAANPQVAALNARDTDLMAGVESVGRQVAIAGNKDPVGFAWVTQNPTTFLAALIDRNPVIKSMLANGMWQNAARVAKVSPQVMRGALVALTTHDDAATPPQE